MAHQQGRKWWKRVLSPVQLRCRVQLRQLLRISFDDGLRFEDGGRFPDESGIDPPIVDVDANIGVVSLLLAKQYPQDRVFSLEPAPTTFDALCKNVALNGVPNISCHQLALSDTVGKFAFDALPHQRGNARIADAKSTHVTMVRTTTLDNFVKSRGWKPSAC